MRRHRRIDLSPETAKALDRRNNAVGKKVDINPAIDATATWEGSRKTKYMTAVVKTLRTMTEPLHRCMYCGDSHGTDVEHFWPKAKYPRKMYEWLNLLLCCAECGRIKGNKFPLSGNQPLLIDPTHDDPWKHLDFDPATGNITARYRLSTDDYDEQGDSTRFYLHLDRRETLAKKLMISHRRLTKLANESINSGSANLDAFLEADATGLLEWTLFGSGSQQVPFVDLVAKFPHLPAEYAQKFR